MTIKEFLLRLKLEREIGYQKSLAILTKLLSLSEVTLADLEKLPEEIKNLAIKAYSNPKHPQTISLLTKQCQIISFFDNEYPDKLRQIFKPPLLLFAKGDISLLKRPITTIVGARQATNYTQQALDLWMPRLSQDFVIASGLAKGADRLAHEAALRHHGKTIAVVGNGLNHFYPEENRNLQFEIIKNGLLISEYLPDTPPRPFRFPERNRILAGLSDNVIVTEAKSKSGSLITANYALYENRNIFALPGSVFSPLSQGPNELIKAGACPLLDLETFYDNIH